MVKAVPSNPPYSLELSPTSRHTCLEFYASCPSPLCNAIALKHTVGRATLTAVFITERRVLDDNLTGFRNTLTRLRDRLARVPGSAPEHWKPTYCAIFLNDSCNLRCRMCGKWRSTDAPDAPTLEHWRTMLEELRALVEPGCLLNITGGEPLLSPMLFPFLALARDLGFKTQLPTNGSLLDEAAVDRLAEAGVSFLTLSLDGRTPALHDYLRGVPGVHAKVWRAIDLLHRRTSIGLNTCTVIQAANLHELVPLAEDLCADERILHFIFQAVCKPFNVELGENWFETPPYAELWPRDRSALEATLDALGSLGARCSKLLNSRQQFEIFKRYFADYRAFLRKSPCLIDQAVLNIDDRGEVFFCLYHGSMGNVKTRGLTSILRSPAVDEHRRRIRACRQNCQSLVNCNFNELW